MCLPKGSRRRFERLWMQVAALNKCEGSLGGLAVKQALDKSATNRPVAGGGRQGYLVNLETRRGRPARIAIRQPIRLALAAATPFPGIGSPRTERVTKIEVAESVSATH